MIQLVNVVRYPFYETVAVCVLLLLSSALYAQKIELAAGAGITSNSLPVIHKAVAGEKPALGFTAAVKVKYRAQNRLSFGLGVDVQQLRSVSRLTHTNAEPSQQVYNIGVPAVNFYAMAERYLWLRNLEVHFGIQAGGTIADNSSMAADRVNYPRSTGYMAGVVIGTGIRLSRHFYVRTELSPRYHILYFGSKWNNVQNIDIFSLPLTMGVAFKL